LKLIRDTSKEIIMKNCLIKLNLALMLGACLSNTALAGPKWSTVGSAGTVDEADTAIVQLGTPGRTIFPLPIILPNPATIGILPTAPAASDVVVRYNIVGIGPLLKVGSDRVLSLRYMDNGNDARVQANLIQMNLSTGARTTLLSFDSNTITSGLTGFQYQGMGTGCPGTALTFDFANNNYFIEAVLTRTSATGTPVISGIDVEVKTLC
jgi:hypothetical protein